MERDCSGDDAVVEGLLHRVGDFVLVGRGLNPVEVFVAFELRADAEDLYGGVVLLREARAFAELFLSELAAVGHEADAGLFAAAVSGFFYYFVEYVAY